MKRAVAILLVFLVLSLIYIDFIFAADYVKRGIKIEDDNPNLVLIR